MSKKVTTMNSRPSRRQLLQAGAVLSAGYFSGLASGASRLANAELRVAAIGVGNHGATNLTEVAKQARVVALCDVDDRYLKPAAKLHPEAKLYRDPRELLAADDLDAVVISTPDHTHAWAAVTAMRRGWHVFCEKPLTHTMAELDLLLRVAGEKKVATQTGMQHWVRTGSRRAAAALQAGLLGEVREIHAWTDRPIWPQGIALPSRAEALPGGLAWDAWLGPASERAYHSAYHPLRWRGWWEFGSGALGDFGPHLLVAIFAGLELPSPETIVAESTEHNDDTFPAASRITFTFGETKTRPAISLVWYDGGRLPPREVVSVDRPPPNGVMVLGERGKLFLPDYGGTPRLLQAKASLKLPPPLEMPDNLFADWIAACRTGQPSCLPFATATALMETCLLGNVALRSGEKLTWDAATRTLTPAPARQFLQSTPRAGWEL